MLPPCKFSCSAHITKEQASSEVQLCSGNNCSAATTQRSQAQLFNDVQQLLAQNEGEKISMCSADPNTRRCKKAKVCHFVLGGILPGNGCSTHLMFNELVIDTENTQISMQTYMPLTSIGTPVKCVTAPSTIKIVEAANITLHVASHYCNWMVMGNMKAELHFTFASIDLERGEVGGYWQHSIIGTGIGSGTGHMILTFPNGIAKTPPVTAIPEQ